VVVAELEEEEEEADDDDDDDDDDSGDDVVAIRCGLNDDVDKPEAAKPDADFVAESSPFIWSKDC